MKLLDRKQIPQGVSISCGAYDSIDTDLQRVEMDDRLETCDSFQITGIKKVQKMTRLS